jgi:tetratricopeptide (TPR) repeat protein
MTRLQRMLLPRVDTRRCIAGLALLLAALQPAAAPYRPQSDSQPLETLPQRLGDADGRELRALRQALTADPQHAGKAAALAGRYIVEAMASGDPRLAGRAQAVLAPWWTDTAPPPAVRVARAMVLQYSHQFEAASADLQAALAQQPDSAEGWAWLAAISLVRADLGRARQACARLAALATPLVGSACAAQVDSLGGQPAAAAAQLRRALLADSQADAEQRLWALTRLAEAEQRQGQPDAAEAAYRQALALRPTDAYLLAAYADLLLDRGRPADVLALLKDRARADALLLRAAIAAQSLAAPEAARWRAELAQRFDAAAQRGDALHQKEQARFVLVLQGDAPRALQLAAQNFERQREPSDARLLLEAALAAKQPEAAAPALAWMQATGHRDPVLERLAAAAKAPR